MARFVRNSGEMLDHLLSLIPADSDILDPDQYNIHQAYGNPSYPIVRAGYRTWASTIQFRGKVVTTRDVNYPVGKFSRLKDICAIVLRRTQELGAQWYFGHTLVKLTRSDEGRVDGAIVKNTSGKLVRFRAAKGAVLCTGNFDSTGLKAGIRAGGHLDNTPMPPVQIRTSGDGARAFGQTAFLLLECHKICRQREGLVHFLAAMENQPGDFITMVTDANWLEQVRPFRAPRSPDFAALSILSRWWRIWPTSPAPGKRATACAAAPSPSGSSSPCTPPTRWRSWLICWV